MKRHTDGGISDEQIVELYWNRNENAIRETDRKYGRYLYTVAYNILHDALDCEECQNDVYLDAWNAIPPTRPAVLQAFLTKIVRRISIDRYKEKSRQKRIPSELTLSMEELGDSLTSHSTVESEYEMSEITEILNRFLGSLSERGRFIFICRYYCADSVPVIADMLGISESGVFKELAKMRTALRARLEEGGIML